MIWFPKLELKNSIQGLQRLTRVFILFGTIMTKFRTDSARCIRCRIYIQTCPKGLIEFIDDIGRVFSSMQ